IGALFSLHELSAAPWYSANSLDSLKTFVESEGIFSPGFGTYGIYTWLLVRDSDTLFAPTMDEITCEHGLAKGGHLVPWIVWNAGDISVRIEICQVQLDSSEGRIQVAASRTVLTNTSEHTKTCSLYLALRPLGPAGSDVKELAVSEGGDALLVDGHPAMIAEQRPTASGVLTEDRIGYFAERGGMPDCKSAKSDSGDCSGALRFDLELGQGESRTIGSLYPVLPGRRATRHQWDGVSDWAQFDLARPNPSSGGVLQPDPSLEYYRTLEVGALFAKAKQYWEGLMRNIALQLPDARWVEAFTAIAEHVGMAMNEGAPDVAVANYNVFNRDGVYVANILQKTGQFRLAEMAIDYFLSHPFNGRSYPEADNPGQILWIMGEHWRFTRDGEWLKRVYPSARKIAEMIRYYRTTKQPHWVQMDSLEFGDTLTADKRRELQPGRCDGSHPEYTEAFDLAGTRAMAMLAKAAGEKEDAIAYSDSAASLFEDYNEKYGENLPKSYGSYSVIWPCRIYPLEGTKAYDQFKSVGVQEPRSWRYFPLATAHQGLLTGNREAGHGTLQIHLEHEQMQGWYAFDEGGKSGSGAWMNVRTTWDSRVAMPHGWAIAELHLLLRDCLVFENDGQLVLLGGVPEDWFTRDIGIRVENLPTHFGNVSFRWMPAEGGAKLTFTGIASPPDGFTIRLPASLKAITALDGNKRLAVSPRGDCHLPGYTREVCFQFWL
ncbi:hypothetical protein ACFL6S_14880, partial [Candidatus Poribacteria bacterium]